MVTVGASLTGVTATSFCAVSESSSPSLIENWIVFGVSRSSSAVLAYVTERSAAW